VKLASFGGAFFILLAERVGMPKEWWRMVSECLRQASVSRHFTPKKLTFQSLYRIKAKSKKAKSCITYF
jgi:hypothetical protein